MTEYLLYLKVTTDISYTRYGYCMMTNLKCYKTNIRNRFIVSYDIISMLTDYFEEETLNECRDIIFKIMSGMITDEELIAEAIKTFYVEDKVFKKFLGKLYYFSKELDKSSLYEVIILTLGQKYRELKEKLIRDTHDWHYKKVAESEGKVYLSVPDELIKLRVPANCKGDFI